VAQHSAGVLIYRRGPGLEVLLINEAREMMLPSQLPLLDRLENALNGG